MEDYKKKYEEVLENIKKIKAANKDNKELVDFIEYEYPELKESEEERVRKALLNEFINLQSKGYKFAGLEGEEIISWLKKQGEQPNKVSLWKHWKDGIAGNGEGKLTYLIKIGNTYNLTSCLGFECDYIELSELDSLMLEKQGEQKPVPDDELSDFESALFSAFSDAWQEYLSGEEVNVAKWTKEHSAELLEVAREQKPAWSEEDEKIMNQIVFNLEKCIVPGFPVYVGGVELGINWLKSIKERIKGE